MTCVGFCLQMNSNRLGHFIIINEWSLLLDIHVRIKLVQIQIPIIDILVIIK